MKRKQYNTERLEKSLNSGKPIEIPPGLTIEQMRQFIINADKDNDRKGNRDEK